MHNTGINTSLLVKHAYNPIHRRYQYDPAGELISHTSALGGFLIGAALGIALVATVAIATFTCGFGVALLAGLAAGIGGSLLTAAGEAIGSMFSSPSGTITTASPNVFINSRKAARVEKSIGACDKHPGPVQIAEGSTNVFINSVAAARKGDKLTCGATISGGSDNVVIGGGTAGVNAARVATGIGVSPDSAAQRPSGCVVQGAVSGA